MYAEKHLASESTEAQESPSVTVVLAAFNGEAYIDEAITSVRRQTLCNWRLIVVDDGSQDHTVEIAERHASEDGRITIIRQANAGVSAARNVGVATAETPWVALLDQDDAYLPDKLERQLTFLHENPEVKCLGTWGSRIGSRGRILGTFAAGPTTFEEFKRLRESGRLIYLLAASVVFDRQIARALGGFRAEPGGTDDIDLWNRFADRHRVHALSDRLVLYRVHGRSESTIKLHVQRLNTERVKHNMRLRRVGQPEVSYEAFVDEWELRPEGVKGAALRTSRSLVLYRRAGALLADRNPVGFWFLFCSAWLRPKLVAQRLANQLLPRKDRVRNGEGGRSA